MSEGKIFVELDRARLTRRLAAMDEAKGDITKAADIMQEVQVETIGGDESEGKDGLSLENSIVFGKKMVPTEIIAKKVDVKALKLDELQSERRRVLSVDDRVSHPVRQLSRHRRSLSSDHRTPLIQGDEALFKPILTKKIGAVLDPGSFRQRNQ